MPKRHNFENMIFKHLEFLIIIVMCALLLSCATNSAQSLINASSSVNPVIPEKKVIAQELKGRAFRLGNVTYSEDVAMENMPNLAVRAYPILLHNQTLKAFEHAALEKGGQPVCLINIIINKLKFTKGVFLFPDPSILNVTMEVIKPDGSALMRGNFESRYMPTILIMVPGVVSAIPAGFKGQEWQAVGKIIPAMAVAITKVATGLQAGKGLQASL